MTERTILLNDINLGAFLELQGIRLSLELQGERVVFEAPDTLETRDAIRAFNSDTPIGANTFARALRNLRGRMLSRRDGDNNGYQKRK